MKLVAISDTSVWLYSCVDLCRVVFLQKGTCVDTVSHFVTCVDTVSHYVTCVSCWKAINNQMGPWDTESRRKVARLVACQDSMMIGQAGGVQWFIHAELSRAFGARTSRLAIRASWPLIIGRYSNSIRFI